VVSGDHVARFFAARDALSQPAQTFDGELLKVALEEGCSGYWPGSREFRAKVADGIAPDVGVCRAT